MTTTLQFLRALYPDPVAPGKLVVWTSTRQGKKHSCWANTLDEAADHAHRVKGTRDVYFGVGLQDPLEARAIVRQRFPRVQMPSVRGCHDSVVALPAIWADLDVAGPGHAADALPPDRRSALELLEAIPHPPSIRVATGGGYHVYWPLRELWTLDDDVERERARGLLRRLQGALRAEARLQGWILDHTADLARVMRLPGTLNQKTDPPRAVKVELFPRDAGGGRYNPDDFDDLPEVVEPAPAARPRGEPEGWVPARYEPIRRGCPWLAHCDEDQHRLSEPEWLATLTIVGRCASADQDAVGLAHAVSHRHPGYHPLKTEEKLEHAVRNLGPRTCAEIEDKFDVQGRSCARCPHRGKIKSPIVLGRDGLSRRGQRPPVAPTAEPPPDLAAKLAADGGNGHGGQGDGGNGNGNAAPREPAQIAVTPREHDVNDQALAALAARETNLFERAGLLVQVVRPRCAPAGRGAAAGAAQHTASPSDSGSASVRPIQEARMGELLARHCAFVRPVMKDGGVIMRPAHPPRWCARALLARGSWPELPHLEGVVECPVLRADGSVLQTPGYDPASGLVYLPSDDFQPVIERPTLDQGRAALSALREAVVDFPFQEESHFAAWLASLLTPLARAAFDGPSPLHLIDANVRGTGKSLLADVGSTLLTGRPAARMSYTGDEDELRKAITGIALEGTRLVLIDNVSGAFGSPTLDRALTADTWRDRLLGGNEQVSVPLRVTWLATGNNVALKGDTPRRCLHIRLESNLERPELRTDFRHPRLLAWVRRERPRLLPAALTLLRAWAATGGTALKLSGWGSYENWSDLVRSAIVWLGLPDPADTREDLETGAGAEQGTVHDLIHGLAELLKPLGGIATAKEILDKLARSGDDFTLLRSALEDLFPRLKSGELPRSTQLAGRLRSYRGRIVRGACVDQASKSYKGVNWTVRWVA